MRAYWGYNCQKEEGGKEDVLNEDKGLERHETRSPAVYKSLRRKREGGGGDHRKLTGKYRQDHLNPRGGNRGRGEIKSSLNTEEDGYRSLGAC